MIWFFSDHATTKLEASPDANPIAGREYTLTCKVLSGRPAVTKYMWYKDHSEFATTDIDSFTIQNLQSGTDDGEYSCSGYNTVGWGLPGQSFSITVWCEFQS